jgi:hypothetical protein
MWWETERDGFRLRQERHRIVYIEYLNRRPHSVVTELHWDHSRELWFQPGRDKPTGTCAEHWDFEWCRRDSDLYYCKSGFGGDPLVVDICRFAEPDPPPGMIWCAPDVKLIRWVSKERPEVEIRSDAVLLRMGYRRLNTPLLLATASGRSRNPFKAAKEIDDSCSYCRICKDYLPWEHECEHLEWCDECTCLVYVDTHVREDDPDGEPVIHEEED